MAGWANESNKRMDSRTWSVTYFISISTVVSLNYVYCDTKTAENFSMVFFSVSQLMLRQITRY